MAGADREGACQFICVRSEVTVEEAINNINALKSSKGKRSHWVGDKVVVR